MVTHTLKEVEALCVTMGDITGHANDYPLVSRILSAIDGDGIDLNIDEVVRSQIQIYLCMSNHCTVNKDYQALGINDILFTEPLENMPLYLNCSDSEILKRVAATWRLTIGK
jgi:hypothetical protein